MKTLVKELSHRKFLAKMLFPNISAFLFVGVVTFVIVGSQANLLKIQVNKTIESTSNRHKRCSHDDTFPFTWRRGPIFEEREIVKKTYSCGNDEFQHEEGNFFKIKSSIVVSEFRIEWKVGKEKYYLFY